MSVLKLITRFFMFAAVPMHAFDPKDPADVALLEEKIAEALTPLTNKNKELLAEVKKAKKGAEITPEQLAEVENERDTLSATLAETNKTLKTLQKTADDATKALASEQGFNHKLLVDNGLTSQLMEAGVKNPVHLKAALALIKSSAEVKVVADGDNRTPQIGGKALDAFVKEWAASDDGKVFVTAPGNSGGGAGGGKGAPPPAGTPPAAGAVVPNMAGNKEERVAAIKARFPDLPTQ